MPPRIKPDTIAAGGSASRSLVLSSSSDGTTGRSGLRITSLKRAVQGCNEERTAVCSQALRVSECCCCCCCCCCCQPSYMKFQCCAHQRMPTRSIAQQRPCVWRLLHLYAKSRRSTSEDPCLCPAVCTYLQFRVLLITLQSRDVTLQHRNSFPRHSKTPVH